MTIKNISLEKSYDPGFTVCLQIDGKTTSIYFRMKDGAITEPKPLPDYREAELFRAPNLMVDAERQMNEYAYGKQIELGWRVHNFQQPKP